MPLRREASRHAHARFVLCSLLAEMAADPSSSRPTETMQTRAPGSPWTAAAGRSSRTAMLTPPL
jgi:hypothetical protein